MKKLVMFFLILSIVTGCNNDLMNTPIKKVETLFSNYITLDEGVIEDLNRVIMQETVMTPDQKDRYKKILKKQYQHLSYEIKDETIDGNLSTVLVEIEVYDYNKVIEEAEDYLTANSEEFLLDNQNTDVSKFNDYKLDKLENARDKITYTLNLTLNKENDTWVLDDLTDTEIKKIHGLYNY